MERGLTRSQARGHPRKGEPMASTIRKARETIVRLYNEGRLRSGQRDYERARDVILRQGVGSYTFDNQAEAIAEDLGVPIRYAYSILFGSP